MIKKTIILIVGVVLLGCSGGPGAPLVRTTAADGEGSLIPGCQNVAIVDTTKVFVTNRYLTTWGSAWREGSAEGAYQGAKKGLEGAGKSVGSEDLKLFAYGWLPSSATFCKVYEADTNKIFRMASDLMPQLGYDLDVVSKAGGVVSTKYAYRAHPHPANAKWKDRYIIRMDSGRNGYVIVKVFRDVYISRRSEGKWSDYIRATSVGHNEAVILNRINEVLSRGDEL